MNLTHQQIIEVAKTTCTAESRDGDYILPISFAEAIIKANDEAGTDTTASAAGTAVAAMERAKKLPVWDSIDHRLHVELDTIFKALAAQPVAEAAAQADDYVMAMWKEWYGFGDDAKTPQQQVIRHWTQQAFIAGASLRRPAAAPTAQPTPLDDERAKFEVWYRANHLTNSMSRKADGQYQSDRQHDYWTVWQAALRQPGALPDSIPPAEVVEGRIVPGIAWGPTVRVRENLAQPGALPDEALEQAARICDEIHGDWRARYKGREPHAPNNPHRADPHADGVSDGASQCADAIRALAAKQAGKEKK